MELFPLLYQNFGKAFWKPSGDSTDVNNCRAIVLSSSVSSILESVFMIRVTSTDDNDCYQFGFKCVIQLACILRQ